MNFLFRVGTSTPIAGVSSNSSNVSLSSSSSASGALSRFFSHHSCASAIWRRARSEIRSGQRSSSAITNTHCSQLGKKIFSGDALSAFDLSDALLQGVFVLGSEFVFFVFGIAHDDNVHGRAVRKRLVLDLDPAIQEMSSHGGYRTSAVAETLFASNRVNQRFVIFSTTVFCRRRARRFVKSTLSSGWS